MSSQAAQQEGTRLLSRQPVPESVRAKDAFYH